MAFMSPSGDVPRAVSRGGDLDRLCVDNPCGLAELFTHKRLMVGGRIHA
jgi:hypothetical protein